MNKLQELIENNRTTSYEKLAQAIGVSRQTLYDIKNGKGTPYILTVKKICKYFGVDYKEYI